MTFHVSGLVAAVVLMAVTTTAEAADTKPAAAAESAAVAAMMDRNRDGEISKDEFRQQNARPGAFEQLDANGDGSLDATEQAGARVGPRRIR